MALSDITALAKAALVDDKRATPGPLTVNGNSLHRGAVVRDCGETIAEFWCGTTEGHGRPNAEWFAAARTREPQLAAWVARVAPAIERLRLALAKDREDFATFSMDIPYAIDALLAAADEP
jgi:hypothetical protein